jgi:hypothetical protein
VIAPLSEGDSVVAVHEKEGDSVVVVHEKEGDSVVAVHESVLSMSSSE